jgi:hypothetical protein
MTISLAKEADKDDFEAGKGVLVCLDASGDTRIVWDPDKPEEVASAERTFDELKAKGYQAFSVKRNGSKDEVIRSFDPAAEKLILAPALRGG